MRLTLHAKKRIAERHIPIYLVDQCYCEGVVVGEGNDPGTEKLVWGDIVLIVNGNWVITAFWN